MSSRLAILRAVKAMIVTALPLAAVYGVDDEVGPPDRIEPMGRIVVRAGDPGDPDIDFSPIRYNYDHQIPIEIATYAQGGVSAEQSLDTMLIALSGAIQANRFLGGLAQWMDAFAPATDDLFAPGATSARETVVPLIVSYSTTSPLG